MMILLQEEEDILQPNSEILLDLRYRTKEIEVRLINTLEISNKERQLLVELLFICHLLSIGGLFDWFRFDSFLFLFSAEIAMVLRYIHLQIKFL
jgi:hypothetical protein